MKKFKIFNWEGTIFELFTILFAGIYIGCFIRLNINYSIENAINFLSVSITFWGCLIMCILFRIGDIVHGKETKMMLEELNKITDETMRKIREENLSWQSRLYRQPKEKRDPKNE